MNRDEGEPLIVLVVDETFWTVGAGLTGAAVEVAQTGEEVAKSDN